jgi:hypothetical protein
MIWFLKSFETKEGKPDGRAITISLSFIMLCTMAILNQIYDMDVEENIYDSFWWIVVIGLGILSPELVSKFSSKLTSNDTTKKTDNANTTNTTDNSNLTSGKGVSGE